MYLRSDRKYSQQRKIGIGYELPKIGVIQLLEDEASRFLTNCNTPWQLHVPPEGRSPDDERACES